MTDTYDWRDLEATAVAEPGSAWVAWTVYEQTAWAPNLDNGTPYYERADQPSSDDTVESIAEAKVWIRTTIKWDGCSELEFPNGMHVCGWPHAQTLHAVHSRLFEMTAWYLRDAYREEGQLPEPRYTPTHRPAVGAS